MILTRIDDLLLPELRYLTAQDECFFLREYTAGQGYAHSDTNNLLNLKKEPSYRGQPAWKYKQQAIDRCGRELSQAIERRWLQQTTLVPIPPSRSRSDPEYDDRIVRVLRALEACSGSRCDIRELVALRRSLTPSHASEHRPGPDALRDHLTLNRELCEPEPNTVTLVDDIITTGAHFRAAKTRLQERWPSLRVLGIFIARAVWPDQD